MHIDLNKVLSCTSEDPSYPAANLLKTNGVFKWRAKAPGEAKISVTFQLAVEVQITHVDIGNDGSALVEVLVGRSADPTGRFEVLLAASSFMSPADAKSATNLARVRSFRKEQLTAKVCEQKWDQVKVVCSQPFSKTLQYGLSFIKIFDVFDNSGGDKIQTKLGAFVIKPAEEEDDKPIETGAFYSLKKQGTLKASDDENEKPVVDSKKSNGNQQTSSSSNTKVKPKMFGLGNNDTSSSTSTSSSNKPEIKTTRSSQRLSTGDTSKNDKSKEIDMKSLLADVVFAMSGYQNPKRGQIRDKAVKMGAKYKPDWGKGCTHLLCAFANTPKYNEVKGKGIIVKAEWIEECFSQKKRLDVSKFGFGRQKTTRQGSDSDDNADSPGSSRRNKRARPKYTADDHSSSDEELPKKKRVVNRGKKDDSEDEWNPTAADKEASDDAKLPDNAVTSSDDVSNSDISEQNTKAKKLQNKSQKNAAVSESDEEPVAKKAPVKTTKPKPKKAVSDDEAAGGWSVVRRKKDAETSSPVKKKKKVAVSDSESAVDTDDEIAKFEAKQQNDNNVYDQDTDVDEEETNLEDLPDIFKEAHFFIYGDVIDNSEQRQLRRIIYAFNGYLDDYNGKDVKYIISSNKWDDNFDEALSDNSGLMFVKPAWLYEVERQRKFVPPHKFQVVSA